MKIKLKIMYYGLLILLCIFYPGEKVNAETKLTTRITLDASEMDSPNNYILNYIEDTGKNRSDIKILKKEIVERGYDVDFRVKFTILTEEYECRDTVIVKGNKKGDELKKQILEALKNSNDRIEEIKEIQYIEDYSILYEVTYEYDPDENEVIPGVIEPKIKAERDLNVTSTYLCKGETLQLKLNKAPKNINKMTWESYDKNVAKVSKTGKVTAVNYGSTYICLTVYVGGKTYDYWCDITVYKLVGFQDGETKITLSRGEGNLEEGDISANLSLKGTDDSIESFAIPYDRIKLDITSNGENLAKIEEKSSIGRDGKKYLRGFGIETYRDGIVTITVSDKNTTCKMEIVIGTGVSRQDPVEAIKKNDFTGYEGEELNTLQTIRAFIDKNNLYSESMPTRDKINYIVDYFIETYKSHITPREYWGHGTLRDTMIYGYGVCACYSETVCFLLDCLGIKNLEISGVAGITDGGPHAWNRVEVDGKWYYLDAYWCACLKDKSTYFLTEELWNDHVKTQEFNYNDEDADIPYINDLH